MLRRLKRLFKPKILSGGVGSFGNGFRNSPDITNLRYWAQKNQITIKDRNEVRDTAGRARGFSEAD